MKITDTSCDTLVTLGPDTRDRHTLFAKYSDRPPTECQPLFQSPHNPAGPRDPGAPREPTVVPLVVRARRE